MTAAHAAGQFAGTRGVLLIVSSPSGAGKTTLTRRLLEEFARSAPERRRREDQDDEGGRVAPERRRREDQDDEGGRVAPERRRREDQDDEGGRSAPDLAFSVSYTTRPQRPGEVDGRDYHFVTPDQFEAMARRGEFAEHAFVFGNRYGTAQAPVEAALARGRDVIFDVDWQGGAALATRWPHDAQKIFILPPDLDSLAARLRNRATDAPDVIERRQREALEELNHFDEYHHLIVNDDVDRAYQVLRAIYLTRRFGGTDRPDIPYPLGELARVVDCNRASGADAHARRLTGRA